MFKFIRIIWQSFKMAMGELRVNKLRTFLSLFGITIGIFCIIGVLATVDSLKDYIQNSLKSLTNKVIWIDKYDYADGNDSEYPWWKYYKRPTLTYANTKFIKENSKIAEAVVFYTDLFSNISYNDAELLNAHIRIVTEDYDKIQDMNIIKGRYLSNVEIERGVPCCIIGYGYAEDLFGDINKAVGKIIELKGRKLYITGVVEKQGNFGISMDKSIVISYHFFTSFSDPLRFNNNIMVKAKNNVPIEVLTDELTGLMRNLHKLNPKEENDFALNDMNEIVGKEIGETFGVLNTAGWAIAGLSLLVGAFGIANIMFVTVRERTSQIGLKKALGAKKTTILTEFLLESAFLSIIGGLFGLMLVWILSLILSNIFPFQIFVAPHIILLAFGICIIIGVLAGIIPAMQAARMDPVVAIRTK